VGNLLVTLSEYGMLYIPGDATTKPALIPTEAKEVFDVSGAGDTSLATLGAALAVGAPMKHAIKIANAAAGIVVGKLGTACVSGAELKQKLTNKEQKSVLTADEAVQLIAKLRQKGYTIGFTNGCFDILHPGHLASFKRARALCDVLFVGLNSDASVQRLKGPTRPINKQDDRAAMLTALRSVDYVVIFDEDSALPLLEKLRPDVIAKEGYPLDKWRGGRFVQSYGGQAVVLPRMDGFSTTTIIEKINK
jgi:D-beta-D-heptose 7-phosphate kinase/D-beta-D-heptose 1-phosphate adenosyltransferase